MDFYNLDSKHRFKMEPTFSCGNETSMGEGLVLYWVYLGMAGDWLLRPVDGGSTLGKMIISGSRSNQYLSYYRLILF